MISIRPRCCLIVGEYIQGANRKIDRLLTNRAAKRMIDGTNGYNKDHWKLIAVEEGKERDGRGSRAEEIRAMNPKCMYTNLKHGLVGGMLIGKDCIHRQVLPAIGFIVCKRYTCFWQSGDAWQDSPATIPVSRWDHLSTFSSSLLLFFLRIMSICATCNLDRREARNKMSSAVSVGKIFNYPVWVSRISNASFGRLETIKDLN